MKIFGLKEDAYGNSGAVFLGLTVEFQDTELAAAAERQLVAGVHLFIGFDTGQGVEAYGPILLGLNAPINDLSRGCNSDEVYKMAIITAAQA